MSTTVIEQDTADVEDITNLQEFCYPKSDILNQASTVGVTYKKNIFDAWVKQPSPCCGAASIASSINALLRLHRSSEKAFNHMDLLNVHKLLFVNRINQKFKSFERKVGFNTLEKFFLPLATILEGLIEEAKAADDKTKTRPIKKKIMLSAIEKYIGNQTISSTNETPSTNATTAESLELESFQSFITQLKAALAICLSNKSTNNDVSNEYVIILLNILKFYLKL